MNEEFLKSMAAEVDASKAAKRAKKNGTQKKPAGKKVGRFDPLNNFTRFQARNLTHLQINVFVFLWAGERNQRVTISNRQLAEQIGASRPRVTEACQDLERLGFIYIHKVGQLNKEGSTYTTHCPPLIDGKRSSKLSQK